MNSDRSDSPPLPPLLRALDRPPWAVLASLVGVALAAFFVLLATLRLIDGDEGYYLYAGRLVLDGRIPYRDFFFTQMPLLPYMHAAVYAVTGPGWISGRMISALSSAVLGTLVFIHVSRALASRAWAVLGVVLYACSCMALGFYPVAKTQAFSALTVFLAWQLIASGCAPSFRLRCLLSGLALGLSVDARLMMAGVFPALAWGAFRPAGSAKSDPRNLACFAAGFGAALLVNVPLFAADPSNFIFGNITYHAKRTYLEGMAVYTQKIKVALELLGLSGNGNGPMAVQNSFLFLFAALNPVLRALSGRRPALIHGVMALMILTAFLPSPCYTQYFTVLLPFMVVCAIETLSDCGHLLGGEFLGPLRRALAAGLAAVMFVYILAGALDVRRNSVTGMFLPAVNTPENAVNWKIATMHEISRRIDQRIPQGAQVVTWWPGYCLESKTTVLPGLESHFGQEIAPILNPEQRRAHHVMTSQDIETMIRERRARMVVLGNWVGDWISIERPHFVQVLKESGYGEIDRVGSAVFYVPLE